MSSNFDEVCDWINHGKCIDGEISFVDAYFPGTDAVKMYFLPGNERSVARTECTHLSMTCFHGLTDCAREDLSSDFATEISVVEMTGDCGFEPIGSFSVKGHFVIPVDELWEHFICSDHFPIVVKTDTNDVEMAEPSIMRLWGNREYG